MYIILNMKILIVGDIHNHVKAAEEIASKYQDTHKIIFIGDYFDDFHDTPKVAANTARWLKESLYKPNRIHLYGNHDLQYTPYCETYIGNKCLKLYMCSGYTSEKDYEVKKILSIEDWDKIKLHHFEYGWHFTHAGMAKMFFEHPIKGMTDDVILDVIEKTNIKFLNREKTDIIGGVGYCRGGYLPVGGITWNDHNQEADPVEGIKQIYGHTPINDIDILEDCGGINICVDCGLSQVLEIDENGKTDIIDTGFDNFYDQKNKNNRWD